MNTYRNVSAALMAIVLAAPAAQAATVNLDLAPFLTGDVIEDVSPGYGSEGPVTLNWNPTGESGRRLIHWNGSYSGRDAAYCASGTNCALDLTVAAGHSVTLDSFWLGGWPDSNRNVTWSVMDLADSSIVASAVSALVSGATGLANAIGATSDTGFRILFGPDGYNAGINDITYSYARTGGPGPAPIPLPAAGWMLIAGLGGLVALRRRKTAA
ncbi:VPLPA-CTERM protein sorting domain-containing protein [Gemmobacter megaterium]|uniref:VPLPA-CTERM protein sorting domain-containing protein n=1 Tax=Gemmobacter megaterium TaxID=1086013 RepID=A0A1N7QF11_9RHOB|nr:VPLPA-CTERM sorting domain-containing protein [Gemmobacter megaterium]GGE25893.1 hypothetical protein GCM10011345_34840 [Gemmobacter megaterium]SIT21471.1 VPLPA-CTERM protein sorting domain-containing protein [Gemmobacter megaterium]